jgi:hypothetical protein
MSIKNSMSFDMLAMVILRETRERIASALSTRVAAVVRMAIMVTTTITITTSNLYTITSTISKR